MQIFNGLNEFLRPPHGSVVTIGNFDGVHLGHQAIIARARTLAREQDMPLIAVTFEPSSVKLLRPEKAPPLLTPLNFKSHLLERQGIDALILIHPTPEFLSRSADDFVRRVLAEQLNARHVVEGQTFSFGHQRSGTMVVLHQLAERYGFQTHLIPSERITLDDLGPTAVSSTLIRQLITTCQFEKAARCLGRPYTLSGRIVRGRQAGRELGFPTANLEPDDRTQLTPEDGVYAGWAHIGDSLEAAVQAPAVYHAAVSIGRCETLPDAAWQIEAHLLDYPRSSDENDEFYGRHMLLSFTRRIRSMKRFNTAAELTAAIADDCRVVRDVLRRDKALL